MIIHNSTKLIEKKIYIVVTYEILPTKPTEKKSLWKYDEKFTNDETKLPFRVLECS